MVADLLRHIAGLLVQPHTLKCLALWAVTHEDIIKLIRERREDRVLTSMGLNGLDVPDGR
jgi:hypothetical protein